MKKSYTEYCPALSAWAKKHGVSPKDYVEQRRQNMRNAFKAKGHNVSANMSDAEEKALLDALDTDPDLNERYYAYMINALELAAVEGMCKRFFIKTPEMAEWLVSCVPDLDKEYDIAVSEVLGELRTVVFHLPTSMGKPSCLLSFASIVVNDGKPTKQEQETARYVLGCYSRQMGPKTGMAFGGRICGLVDKESNELTRWYIRLAYGVMLYAHCFPEAIREGLPEDLAHPAHHDYTAKTLEVHPDVCHGGTHASPIAHYRSGHFRTYRDERYTKVKGQTLFVRESFVKGKAHTVLEPEAVK